VILAGDVGGTKTLVALYAQEGDRRTPRFERSYRSSDYADFASLLARFRDEAAAALGARPRLTRACFGVAGPVEGERVKVTNLPWEIDARALARAFDIERVSLVNDFAAAACGVEALGPSDLVTLQQGEPVPDAPRVVLGAGTGLGIAYTVAERAGYRVIPGEGGHVGFAPADEDQVALWRRVRAECGRVELEHILSGSGLARIYAFLRTAGRHPESDAVARELAAGDAAAAIARNAINRNDPLASAALDLFVACYGAAAGDQALAVAARGGVYVAGGIAPKILPRLAAGGFVAAFNAKGAFTELARKMPVRVVVDERIGLLGAALCASRL
jgi:glucokinase